MMNFDTLTTQPVAHVVARMVAFAVEAEAAARRAPIVDRAQAIEVAAPIFNLISDASFADMFTDGHKFQTTFKNASWLKVGEYSIHRDECFGPANTYSLD